jgi:hypothetical protein
MAIRKPGNLRQIIGEMEECLNAPEVPFVRTSIVLMSPDGSTRHELHSKEEIKEQIAYFRALLAIEEAFGEAV